MTQEDITYELAKVKQRAESNTRRVEKLELQTEAIQSLATSVEVLVNEQKHQTTAMMDIKKDVAQLDGKVDALEKKPAKRWDAIVDKLVWALLAAVVTFLLSRIGL